MKFLLQYPHSTSPGMQLRIPYSSADVGGLRYLRNGVVSDRDLDRTRFGENSSGSSTLGVPTLKSLRGGRDYALVARGSPA
jgi:hypothetical protein